MKEIYYNYCCYYHYYNYHYYYNYCNYHIIIIVIIIIIINVIIIVYRYDYNDNSHLQQAMLMHRDHRNLSSKSPWKLSMLTVGKQHSSSL